ncbi:hypothetical protein SDRG_12641 [Saprolegnia diclina VS20]|uniref:Amino acid permease/ SLC12A domain-containing protein n=1 Tax=Saprolegnia diclina (strain VS20) TaxID=1156394 RepID=T0RIG2_SAPDV|nr:hypothetical protein SDRG_12641 [Saprolegnia diclina VS20]EQC29637.1 hypothetical protein SDRG_12641 [Saprolegnia diclina VS20]|eukprot:XP_008616941.1 hypothetical protein SDRG_12641 [Saprolegnia diclina VS20]
MVSSSRGESSLGLGIDAAFLVRRRHLWAFSLSIVLSGQYLARWDASDATLAGVTYLLLASAFYSMSVCTSDLLAAIPFSGGAFGLARVAIGFYGGYLVAIAECFEYVLCTADAVQSLGATIALVSPDSTPFLPIAYLVIYVLLTRLHLVGGPSVWNTYTVLAATTILGLLMYICSSVPQLERRSLRTKSGWSSGFELAALAPSQMRLFMGLECLNLCGQDVDDPQITLPIVKRRAMRVAVASSFVLGSITVVFAPLRWTAPSQYPPLAPGFADSWGVSMQVASFLSVPSMLASALCFMHGYSRVLSYMGSSRLVHRSLRRRVGRHRTPRRALYVGSALSILACLTSHYLPLFCLRSCAAACASIMYMAQCYGYIYFTMSVQRQASAVARGAVARRRFAAGYATVVFGACFVACCATALPSAPEYSNVVVVGVLASVTLLCSVYYYNVVKSSQLFSEHERRSLMVAHIIVFNKNKLRQSTQRLKKIITSQRAAMYIKRASLGTTTVPTVQPATAELLRRKTANDIPLKDASESSKDLKMAPELARATTDLTVAANSDTKSDEGLERTMSAHKVMPTLTRHYTVSDIRDDRRSSFSIQANRGTDRRPSFSIKSSLNERRPSFSIKSSLADRRQSFSLKPSFQDRRPSFSIKPNLNDRRLSFSIKPSLSERRLSFSIQGAGAERRPSISLQGDGVDRRPSFSLSGDGRRSSAAGRHGALRSILGKQHLGSARVTDLAVLFQDDAEDDEDDDDDGCIPIPPLP